MAVRNAGGKQRGRSGDKRPIPLPTNPPDLRIIAAINAAKARVDTRRVAPTIFTKTKPDGVGVYLDAPHSDATGWHEHMCDTFGTASSEFMEASFQQLANVANHTASEVDARAASAAVAAVAGIAPQNEAEAMLASQMAGTHIVAMEILRRTKFASDIRVMQEYGTLATKLLRTYTAQMETLARVRRKGEQNVIVKHVHVHEGGQAIVGNVSQSAPAEAGRKGGAANEKGQQPHAPNDVAALTYEPSPEVWGANTFGEALPVACGQRSEAMPDARRRQ